MDNLIIRTFLRSRLRSALFFFYKEDDKNTQIKANDLQKKVTGYLETLVLESDLARKSETMQKYLELAARFHQYSPTNIFLILLAKPDASFVAGLKKCQSMDRYISIDEHGILYGA